MPDTATMQARTRPPVPIVDTDTHNMVPTRDTLWAYMPSEWREFAALPGRGPHGRWYPKHTHGGFRGDAWPQVGPPGSDLALMRSQHLDPSNVEVAILNPVSVPTPGAQFNLEFGAVLANAVNSWTAERWLDEDPRLRASIVVQYEDADLAIGEIERRAADKRFVQVILDIATTRPLGNRRYWKIYEAAQRHDLPVALHTGGMGGNPPTAAGWPSYYLEAHSAICQRMQAQLVSLVCDGVFERFPRLRVVAVEGGVSWLPPLMWRLDRSWERFRAEVPHVKRPPSEYLMEHIWLTTQPIEEPPEPRQFAAVFDWFPLAERLMFSTDYPHWDYDDPTSALKKGRVPTAAMHNILRNNARRLYGF
jgi:predicted TIM-barrel fold metal-dependent hydrolase